MMRILRKHFNYYGFSLIELIVVIAILAVLAGIAYPATKGVLDKSRMESDRSHAEMIARQIELAFLHHRITETVDFQNDQPVELNQAEGSILDILLRENYIKKIPKLKYYTEPMYAKIKVSGDDVIRVQMLDAENQLIYDSNP